MIDAPALGGGYRVSYSPRGTNEPTGEDEFFVQQAAP
jgi:hypothetical protein